MRHSGVTFSALRFRVTFSRLRLLYILIFSVDNDILHFYTTPKLFKTNEIDSFIIMRQKYEILPLLIYVIKVNKLIFEISTKFSSHFEAF